MLPKEHGREHSQYLEAFLSGQKKMNHVILRKSHLVRDGYDGFLVTSSMLHAFVERSHSRVIVHSYLGRLDHDPS
jgi:hypothetical protein